jgi:hypothetical protein
MNKHINIGKIMIMFYLLESQEHFPFIHFKPVLGLQFFD